MPAILGPLALAEFSVGRWPDAEATATEGYDAATQAGDVQNQAIALAARALVRAVSGRPVEARTDAEGSLGLTGERSVALARIHAQRALALLDLLADRPQDAAERLTPLRCRLVAAGVGEPGAIPFAPDEIEALVTAGRISAAEDAVDWLETCGRRLDRASALAGAQRGRGLLAAATGAHDAAIAAFECAVEQHGRLTMPFERARTLLHLGVAQRRAKRKRDARATLTEARRTFDALGASPWSQRAGEELTRISGRRPGGSGLTATERRIAAEAAHGRSNREIAAALFLSERTVEANLTRVYRKLGVRSRAQLARQLPDA
jgi:DNA-binding CsgD family transcriptional regulator